MIAEVCVPNVQVKGYIPWLKDPNPGAQTSRVHSTTLVNSQSGVRNPYSGLPWGKQGKEDIACAARVRESERKRERERERSPWPVEEEDHHLGVHKFHKFSTAFVAFLTQQPVLVICLVYDSLCSRSGPALFPSDKDQDQG